MLAVSDTGSGMSKEVQDKVFEPFFTTKEVGKGSGLGLSMVYGFVKQSGGHIKIYSEEGHGTTIKLYLPPAARTGRDARPAARRVAGGSETILVVEDDALVRDSSPTQLQSLGYKTIDAADGPAALAAVDNGETVRPAVHRRDPARRHDRPAARRGDRQAPARPEGAVHLGLYRQCDRAPGPARSRRAAAEQALSEVAAGQDDPPGADRASVLARLRRQTGSTSPACGGGRITSKM